MLNQWLITWLVGFGLVGVGFVAGVDHTRKSYIYEKQAAQVKEVNQSLDKLTTAVTELSTAQDTFTKGVLNDKENAANILSAISTGAKRLSIAVKPAVCPSTTASATASVEEVRTELSRASSEFLIGEAGRADEVVRTLQLCQATLKTLQETNNGKASVD